MNARWILVLPLLLFVGISVFLASGLFSDPRYQNQAQLQRPLPAMQLPDLIQPQQTYNERSLYGQVTLLNVWGVWCVTCDVELPFLAELAQQGVRIVGLYVPESIDPDFGVTPLPQLQREVQQKLARLGNPYLFNIFDLKREYSLDLGVTGAPETFVIDKQGIIRLHLIGDVNPQNWQQSIEPLYRELLAQ